MVVVRIKTGKGVRKVKLKRREQEAEDVKTGVISQGYQEMQPEKPAGSRGKFVPHPEVSGLLVPGEEVAGTALPRISESVKEVEDVEKEEMQMVNIKYPLIPKNPKGNETVFAWAHIYFDKRLGEVIYVLHEPGLTNKEKNLLENIKEYIQEKLDVNFAQVRKRGAMDYIKEIFMKSLKYFRLKFDGATIDKLQYFIMRDFIGMEKIEPLMQDSQIEDISCDGVGIPIYVYHRDPRLGTLRTNIVFDGQEELDNFVTKISERSGKTISVANPLLDGTLPGGSRVQATLGSDIARRGSNFTIRMFTERPLTPVDMIKFGTCNLQLMSYYWYLIEHGSSMLISGGTASGKTSLLNALSLFIKPQMKIVSIEDTSELRLPHPHWISEVARTPISEEGKIDMFELLRESLRQRPDYIIVGEVRGKEAYVLFQQMATGHPGLSTIHAENFQKLVDRLTTPPINLPANLITNLDLIVFLRRIRKGRKYTRRAIMTTEVLGYDRSENSPIVNDLFEWDPREGNFVTKHKSVLLKRLSDKTGVPENKIVEDIKNRAEILKWLVERNITDYKKIASIINMFYLSPDMVMRRVSG